MAAKFELTRDKQGAISYGLQLVGAKKYNNNFAIDEEVFIIIEPSDKFVIFMPQLGGYRVSSDPNPALPSVASGTEMQIADTTQSVAHIDLFNWPESVTMPEQKRIYILSQVAQNITALVYEGDHQ